MTITVEAANHPHMPVRIVLLDCDGRFWKAYFAESVEDGLRKVERLIPTPKAWAAVDTYRAEKGLTQCDAL